MKRIAPWGLAILAGTALPAQAGMKAHVHSEGTPVVIVGEVTSQPKDYGFTHEKKMQISTSPNEGEHTLHLSSAQIRDYFGRKLGVSDLHDKMWIRAEGQMMDDTRRIKVTRLEVIGNDRVAFEQSVYFRPQVATGYMSTVESSVAGSRETLPDEYTAEPYAQKTMDHDVDMQALSESSLYEPTYEETLSDPAFEDLLYEEMSSIEPVFSEPGYDDVSTNDSFSMDVPADDNMVDPPGDNASAELPADVEGTLNELPADVEATLNELPYDDLQSSETAETELYFSSADPMGYVTPMPGTDTEFQPREMRGVITSVDERGGLFTLRDDEGNDHIVYAETMTLHPDGTPVDVKTLHEGQQIRIHGSDVVP